MQYLICTSKGIDRSFYAIVEGTGFRATAKPEKATHFDSIAKLLGGCHTASIFSYIITPVFSKACRLSKFEQFCWDNNERPADELATETNRTITTVTSAQDRAVKKMEQMVKECGHQLQDDKGSPRTLDGFFFQTKMAGCLTRQAVAACLEKYGYTAYIGGHHIAFHNRQTDIRLGIITNPNLPDFN